MISAQWLAGFFDGEGCINITVAGKHRRCILRLYLVNTDENLLQTIQEQYGGQFTKRPHSGRPTWKPYCALIWTNRQAVGLLDRIGEFIILKRAQLDLAKAFLALRLVDSARYDVSSVVGVPSRRRKFIRQIKPSVLALEADMKQRMHMLNKKGRVA